jgi:hypothetical protein
MDVEIVSLFTCMDELNKQLCQHRFQLQISIVVRAKMTTNMDLLARDIFEIANA